MTVEGSPAGGSARAVVFGLIEHGVARIHLVNRTVERAQALRERAIIVRHFAKPERISDFLRITVGNPDQCAALIAGLKQIVR